MNTDIVLDKLNIDEALRYLGCVSASENELSADNGKNAAIKDMRSLVEGCEELVRNTAIPRYALKVVDIEDSPEGVLCKDTSLVLKGNAIRKHLEGCRKAVLMSVTVSADIDRLIRKAQIKDMAEAMVIDSLSSVAVEQVCDKVEELIRNKYPEYYQTFRFGVGYYDLPIDLQKDFLKVCDATRRIGLSVSPSNILMPTKSVTAVIGLSENEVAGVVRGCATCNRNNNCQFRKKGGRCNG